MALILKNLTKRFGAFTALNNVCLTIEQGELIGVIGRSGAGKSTLLRCINRLETAEEGEILWQGQNMAKARGKTLRQWRTCCAMIFQDYGLVDRLDVLTNVLIGRLSRIGFWRSFFKMFSKSDRALAVLELHRLGMEAKALETAGNLSGGQKQRVAIARAMVQDPEILLADEPVSALDPANTRYVMDALRDINVKRGVTILINVHDIDLAISCCSRIIALDAGRVVFDGPAHTLDQAGRARVFGLETEIETQPEVEPA